MLEHERVRCCWSYARRMRSRYVLETPDWIRWHKVALALESVLRNRHRYHQFVHEPEDQLSVFDAPR